MICHNCGSEVIDGSAVCDYCGAALAPAYQGIEQPGPYDGSLQWGAEQYGYDGQPQAACDIGYGDQPTGYDPQPMAYDAGYSAGYDGQPSAYNPGYDGQQPAGYDTGYAPQPQAGYDPGYAPQPQAGYDVGYGAQPQAGYDAGYIAQPYEAAQAAQPYGAAEHAQAHETAQPSQAYTTAQSPQAYAAVQPAQPYGAAQSPQTKKSKTGLIVGIIIAAVVVLGGGIGGYFIYQGVTGDAQAAREPSGNDTGNDTGNDPAATSGAAADDPAVADPGQEPAPPSGSDTSSRIDPNTPIADFQNPYVILDEKDIKITIDVGSGEGGNSDYLYEVRCVVENKTDKTYDITLSDASANNYSGSAYSVRLSKGEIKGNSAHNDSRNYQPGGNLAYFGFIKEHLEGPITDFKVKIFLSEVESRNVISEYTISVPAM